MYKYTKITPPICYFAQIRSVMILHFVYDIKNITHMGYFVNWVYYSFVYALWLFYNGIFKLLCVIFQNIFILIR